jgi:hypothetical protein
MPNLPQATPDEIVTPGTRYINGQLMTWQPNSQIDEAMNYLGISREQAARMNGYQGDMADIDTPGTGAGNWVPGTYAPDHFLRNLGIFLGMGAAGGLGAGLIGAAAGGGAASAAGGGAGAGAGTAAATGAGTAAATGGTAAGVGAGAGTAAATGGTAAGVGAGAGTAAGVGTGAAAGGAGAGTTAASTGGILSTIGKVYNSKAGEAIKTGLDVAGAVEKGRAAERAQTDAANAARYNAERANAITNFSAPLGRAEQVGLGDIMANWQPLTYENGKFSGGLSPALLGPNSRAAGQALSKTALDAMLSGNPAGLPTIPDRVSPTGVDTALNVAGTLGGAAGAYDAAQTAKKQNTALQTIIDTYGRPRPGAATTAGVAPDPGRAASMLYNDVSSPSISFAPRGPDTSDPMDLVNMPANRALLGRTSSGSGRF